MIKNIFLIGLAFLPFFAKSQITKTVTASCSGDDVEFVISSLGTAPTASSFGNGVCVTQCTSGPCVSYGVTARVTTMGVTATVTSIVPLFGVEAGSGTPPSAPSNGASGVFRAVASSDNFRKGWVRFVYTRNGGACECTAELNVFKTISTSDLINNLSEICLTDGQTNIPFLVDPKFSRGIGDGIGVDEYEWSTDPSSPTWGSGTPAASGDNAAITLNAPSPIPQPCTLKVLQGTACNTATRDLVIKRSLGQTSIALSNPSGVTTNGLSLGPTANSSCLEADQGYISAGNPSNANDQGQFILTVTPTADVTYFWSTVPAGFDVVDFSTGTTVQSLPSYQNASAIRVRAKPGTSGASGTFSVTTTPDGGLCGGQSGASYTVFRKLVATSAHNSNAPYNNIICTSATGASCPATGNCITPGPGVTYTLGINNLPQGVPIYWDLNAAGAGQNWSASFSNPTPSIIVTAPNGGTDPDLISITNPECAITPDIDRQFVFPGAPTDFTPQIVQQNPSGSAGTQGKQTFGISYSSDFGDWPPEDCSDSPPLDPTLSWRFVGSFTNAASTTTDYPGTANSGCQAGTGGTSATAPATPTSGIAVFNSSLGVNATNVRLRPGTYSALTGQSPPNISGPSLFVRVRRDATEDGCNSGDCIDCEYRIDIATGAYRPSKADADVTDFIPMESKSFKVYPNPSLGDVEIEFKDSEKAQTIFITTLDGKIIQTLRTDEGQKKLNVKVRKQGVYLVLPENKDLFPVSFIIQ